jgi:hypothetical protein
MGVDLLHLSRGSAVGDRLELDRTFSVQQAFFTTQPQNRRFPGFVFAFSIPAGAGKINSRRATAGAKPGHPENIAASGPFQRVDKAKRP